MRFACDSDEQLISVPRESDVDIGSEYLKICKQENDL